jgi:2-hydroxychromene-2-carboxylate isomerase
MKTSHLLIAGTLTFNMALTAALIRSNPEFSALLRGQTSVTQQAASESQQRGMIAPRPVLTRSAESQAYILDTVRANPEAVRDAFLILEARGELPFADPTPYEDLDLDVSEVELDIEDAQNVFVGGNPDGDVTIVQFFDYNCPHCKRAAPVVNQAVSGDGNIRLLYREYPILTPGSAFAARAALASRKQGLYEKFHYALMSTNDPIDEKTTLAIAKDLGLDIIKLTSDMEDPAIVDHLRRSQDLALETGIEGTPSFVINGDLNVGAPSAKALKEAIDKARIE